MKKLVLIITILFFITGCEKEVKEEEPSYALLGGDNVTAEIGTYQDPGFDADIRLIDVVTNYVKDTLGTFTSTYNFTGGYTLTRTITIVDTTDPVVTFNGSEEVVVYSFEEYEEQGVTVTDATLVTSVEITTFNEDSAYGTYTVEYIATDEADNTTTVIRTIIYNREAVKIFELRPIKVVSPNSYAALALYDENEDGFIDDDEARIVTSLLLDDLRIEDFSFLAYFYNLEELILLDSKINDLFVIDTFYELRVLIVSNANLKGEITISDYPYLTELDLSGNDIETIIGLDRLDSLTTLYLDDNSFSNLHFLVKLDNRNLLETFSIQNNNLTSLNNIAQFPNIIELNVSGNDIAYVGELSTLSSLSILDVNGIPLTSISGIQNLSLAHLSLNANDLENITAILDMDTLTYLNLAGYKADFDDTRSILALKESGVEVHYKSLFDIDPDMPLLQHGYAEIVLVEGDSFDTEGLVVTGLDLVDGYITEDVIFDGIDISTLTPGIYDYGVTVTDSDGNTTTITIPLVIQAAPMDFSNTVVFVKFNDEDSYNAPYENEHYIDMFNASSLSVSAYFDEVSDGRYDTYGYFINSTFNMYVDVFPRAYYQPYDEDENPIGYEDEDESYDREEVMIKSIGAYLKDTYNNYGSLDFDIDDDGYVDGLSILVSGKPGNWEDLLWPHQFSIDPDDAYMIGDAKIRNYNIAFLGYRQNDPDSLDLAVLCHEIFHMMGGEDYYHYYTNGDIDPVGYYDLMNATDKIPTEMLAYTKEVYGGWTQSKIIVENGTDTVVTLNKTSSSSNNALQILFPGLPEEIWMEFRVNEGDYDSQLNGDGVLIYYTNGTYWGNSDGMYDADGVLIDELIVYRDFDFSLASDGSYIISGDPGIDFPTLYEGGPLSAGIGTDIPLFGSDGFPKNITITISNITTSSVTVTIDFLD